MIIFKADENSRPYKMNVAMLIKTIIKFIVILLLTATTEASVAQQIPIIPIPKTYTRATGEFILSEKTSIVLEGEHTAKVAYYLQNEVLKSTGITLNILPEKNSPVIKLSTVPTTILRGNIYKLAMSATTIEIQAADEEGLFLGAISLLQLVRQTANIDDEIRLSNWNVEDNPMYHWRGVMLDESRHFFGKEKVKQLLDWMAFYKLNKFHWHLVDQPGWRIEIKKYPRLTLVGGIGNHSDALAPARYYNQDDIREIVDYAADRFIEVIPEIDMPGHATAANRAYPEYSGGGSAKYPEFTFNPGKESTYQYLADILKEVNVLFPSRKIHIGADEVHFGNQHWNVDADVQRLMREKNFKDLKEVEFYFVERMADSLVKMDNEILAWDEVVDSDLPIDKTTVFWWRHDKDVQLKNALDKGFKTVLCPRIPLYFDFVQDKAHTVGRKWSGDFAPIEKVYNFPSQDILDLPEAGKLIQGIQANLWTESISKEQQLDFIIFPRITALAESAWTSPTKKDYQQFQKRMKRHLRLFAEAGLYYYDPFNPTKYGEFLGPVERLKIMPDTDELTKQEQTQ